MSSILDALKKSERQRSLGRDLIFRSASQDAPPRLTRLALAVLVTIVFLAVAMGLLWFGVSRPEPTAAVVVTTPAARPDVAGDLVDQTRSTTRPVTAPKPPASVAAPSPKAETGAAPWVSSLPEAFRVSLPPLVVNIHVYSPDESRRILYINNRQVRQGERIQAGVLVEEIAQDGVVLRFRGQRFKLPRPS